VPTATDPTASDFTATDPAASDPTATDPSPAITALRHSHDRLTALLHGLDADGIRQESYDEGWPIAQVASHLGSQAEIFGLMLDAGLTGDEMPGMPVFQQTWARWDASTPEEQIAGSIEANEALVGRIEGLSAQQREQFAADLFGVQADLNRFVVMKLAEHAIHTWDVATALDPAATVSADAVDLLLDGVPALAARGAKPTAEPRTIGVTVTDPDHRYLIVTGPAVSVTEAEDGDDVDATLTLPAEAFLRLVYGRLDPAHVPSGVAESPEVATLRTVFRGL